MKLGVIDLGTNTFHLLIVEVGEKGTFVECYRKRIYVQLAEDGIAKIGKAPFQRGMNALQFYAKVLEKQGVSKVKAFGTAALRTASNGAEFIQQVKAKTGLQIELISGMREARLICQGVRLAVPMSDTPILIMDIGGGSVEFIIANDSEVFWEQSFPIGVAVLFNSFHKNDPISTTEIKQIKNHLTSVLRPLTKAISSYQLSTLIGASGTFDVLESILSDKKTGPFYTAIPASDFHPIYDELIVSNLAERLKMSAIPDSRAKLIIVAMVLIEHILTQISIDTIWVSSYAMKEGILTEMMVEE